MPRGTVSKSMNVGGIGMAGSAVRTKDGQIGHEVALVAADDGVQAGFVGVNECSVTLAAGNVSGDGDIVDVYWEVAGILYVKYGADSAVVGQVATLTGGTGDNFIDSVGMAMNICEQIVIDTDFDGDEVEMMAALCDRDSHMEFWVAATHDGIKLLALEGWDWIKGGEVTNPVAGVTITDIRVSNGDPDNAATMKIGVLYNSA